MCTESYLLRNRCQLLGSITLTFRFRFYPGGREGRGKGGQGRAGEREGKGKGGQGEGRAGGREGKGGQGGASSPNLQASLLMMFHQYTISHSNPLRLALI